MISKRYGIKKQNSQWIIREWISFRKDIGFSIGILYYGNNNQNNVNPKNGTGRDATGNERHFKILKGYIFRTNLFFKNVKVGSKSRGNKQLADSKVIFKKGNLFSSSVDFCHQDLWMNMPIRVGYVF